MNMRDALLQEFDLERPLTRRCLERVPEGKNDWQPHEKSMTLGWLSTFLAISPSWGVAVMEHDVFDPSAQAGPPPKIAETNDQLLRLFDDHYAKCRDAIAKASEEHLLTPWTLNMKGGALFTQPRWLVLREYIFNHIVHHRAQLGIYLRMNDISVPAIYNDSADEQGGVFR